MRKNLPESDLFAVEWTVSTLSFEILNAPLQRGRRHAFFPGRGWGRGVGTCKYGVYRLAKMGIKADRIIKHDWTGVDVTKAY